ncbi:MAG: glycosyltransferase family 2 protein [Dehalococcoidales bacterium]|nr:glycosyltransferase family 2 protein [Dehalococcoidales bacterium]
MNVQKPANCPAISVIICALNEAENLPHVLPGIPGWVDEILLVDGHSNDSTIEVAKTIRPDLKVIAQPGKGKGDALKFGFKNATGEIVVTMDADGSTDPADLPKYIEALINGYDFAKGSRFLNANPKMPLYHKFGNRVLISTTNILFGTRYTDVCSGYNALRKEDFLRLNLRYDGFEMEQEMVVKAKKAGLKAVEIRQIDKGRIGNVSKVSSFKQGFKDFFIIIKERF